jgi:hypothetical protein
VRLSATTQTTLTMNYKILIVGVLALLTLFPAVYGQTKGDPARFPPGRQPATAARQRHSVHGQFFHPAVARPRRPLCRP